MRIKIKKQDKSRYLKGKNSNMDTSISNYLDSDLIRKTADSAEDVESLHDHRKKIVPKDHQVTLSFVNASNNRSVI